MQISKQKNPTRKDELVTGFIGGLNLFQDETSIKNGELTEAKNVLLNNPDSLYIRKNAIFRHFLYEYEIHTYPDFRNPFERNVNGTGSQKTFPQISRLYHLQ